MDDFSKHEPIPGGAQCVFGKAASRFRSARGARGRAPGIDQGTSRGGPKTESSSPRNQASPQAVQVHDPPASRRPKVRRMNDLRLNHAAFRPAPFDRVRGVRGRPARRASGPVLRWLPAIAEFAARPTFTASKSYPEHERSHVDPHTDLTENQSCDAWDRYPSVLPPRPQNQYAESCD